jgi:arylsulfatase A-like enzyme
MNRRDFVTSSAILFSAPYVLTHRRTVKPNLLFIWTDEQRRDTMAAYGNTWIQTPHLNQLARESMVLEHAYISQPVCTPSRATVMTGLWPHQHTCRSNNILLPESIACQPELVNDPDYRTMYMGKWHLGDEIFAQHGFQEWVSIEDGYRKYFRPHQDKSRRSSYWHFLNEQGYQPDEAEGYYSRNFASRLPIEHCKPKFLETQAIDFMQRHCSDPFMLYVNFLEPHMPFNGPLNDLYDPAALPLPKNFHDPLEENEPLRYRLLRQNYINRGFGGEDLKTEKGWRRLMAHYYGLVTQVDRSVGAILAELERLGLAENTIVVFTSDHGDMMGSHQLLAKTVMYEESIGVPWLMRIPGWKRKQRLVPGRFSHIDMVPTLLELLDRPADLPGKSLLSTLRNNQRTEDPVFIQWNGSEGETPANLPGISSEQAGRVHNAAIRTVITQEGWKLCLSERDRHQLFNLHKDPCEMTNLYEIPHYQKEILRLRRMIDEWQAREKDPIEI